MSNYTEAVAALWPLVERYPACFFMLEARRKPLEIGIRDKLLAAGVIKPDDLNLALRFSVAARAIYALWPVPAQCVLGSQASRRVWSHLSRGPARRRD
jgi:hypothetical protein